MQPSALDLSKEYTDAELVLKIRSGETKLYELLIRRNNPYLYRIGRSYGFNHQDAEDLMQETYINAFFALESFANKSAFKTWITRIMLNNCFRKKQKNSFRNELPADDIANEKNTAMYHTPADSESPLLNKELGRVLENALVRIPEEYRIVFTLRELNGLSVAETAEAALISEANVKTRLSRAKNMLRNEIGKMYSPSDLFEFNEVHCDRMVATVFAAIQNCGSK